MKILFFGSSDECLPILESLPKNHQVCGIITKPDKPTGRKQILTPSSAKQFAVSHNIVCFTPGNKLELLTFKNQILHCKPDLAIVVDYGLIIPKDIFTLPRYKTLNIHFSKLPKFRGPSPIPYTILLGEKSAWITVFILEEHMDTGDIVWQKEIPLTGNETTIILKQKLFNIISMELPGIITQYISNDLKSRKQDHSQATYTKLFTRWDGFIPSRIICCTLNGENPKEEELKKWPLSSMLDAKYLIRNTPAVIERALRAFSPWPGVWTQVAIKHLGGDYIGSPEVKGSIKRLKILKAHLETFRDRHLKTIRDRQALVVDLVQLEGKKPVAFRQFMQGYPQFSFIDGK